MSIWSLKVPTTTKKLAEELNQAASNSRKRTGSRKRIRVEFSRQRRTDREFPWQFKINGEVVGRFNGCQKGKFSVVSVDDGDNLLMNFPSIHTKLNEISLPRCLSS